MCSWIRPVPRPPWSPVMEGMSSSLSGFFIWKSSWYLSILNTPRFLAKWNVNSGSVSSTMTSQKGCILGLEKYGLEPASKPDSGSMTSTSLPVCSMWTARLVSPMYMCWPPIRGPSLKMSMASSRLSASWRTFLLIMMRYPTSPQNSCLTETPEPKMHTPFSFIPAWPTPSPRLKWACCT